MRVLSLFLIFSALFMAVPSHAGDEAHSVNAEPPKDQSQSGRVARPPRKAVKLSPAIRVSPPHPDESGNMRRIAPASSDSPLQNIPALKDVMPPAGESSGGR